MFSFKFINWSIFVVLCLIWGSSFILMKFGMYGPNQQLLLSAYQVATLRILSAGIVLLPFAIFQFKKIPFNKAGTMFFSGLFGNFLPAFLFCIAETKIDSGLTGTLNALTPIFVVISGAIFYHQKTSNQKIWGIVVGLLGSILLFLFNKNHSLGNLSYVFLVVLATVFYGINVNMVRQKLQGVPSITIASFAFVSLIIPCLIILYFTGYFSLPLHNQMLVKASLASVLLGVLGTAFASVIFYMLVKRGGGIFASLVTYGIPFVAVAWAKWYGEDPSLGEIFALLIILAGVYLANRKNGTNVKDK